MSRARQLSDYVSTAGRKNLIINGDMRVIQRNPSDTPVLITSTAYTNFSYQDRWRSGTHTWTGSTSSQVTVERPLEDGKYWYKSVITAPFVAGGAYVYRGTVYIVEAQDVTSWAGKTLTLSFLFKAKTNGQYSFAVGSAADNKFSIFSWNYTGAGSEQRVTKTFTLPSFWDSDVIAPIGRGLSIYMCYGVTAGSSLEGSTYVEGLWPTSSGSTQLTHPNDFKFWQSAGEWFAITNVQLEFGSVATEFEQRSYAEELALCQRYFFAMGNTSTALATRYGFGVANSTGTANVRIVHPVPMRNLPTLTINNLSAVTLSDTVTNGTVTNVSIQTVVSDVNATGLNVNQTGLTTYRPYYLEGKSTAVLSNLQLDAEI